MCIMCKSTKWVGRQFLAVDVQIMCEHSEIERYDIYMSSDHNTLEAFSVDNAWPGLVKLFPGDPHLLECGKVR